MFLNNTNVCTSATATATTAANHTSAIKKMKANSVNNNAANVVVVASDMFAAHPVTTTDNANKADHGTVAGNTNNPLESVTEENEDNEEQVLSFQPDQNQKDLRPPIVLDRLPAYLTLKNFDENYKIVTTLGTGSFGVVQLCKESSGNLNIHNTSTTSKKNNFTDTYRPNDGDVDQVSNFYLNTMLNHAALNPNDNYYNKKSKLVAIKTMMTRLNFLSDYSRVRELKFIFKIPSHTNLLTIYDCFIDSNFYKLHISMEVMDQNLYQLIKYRNLHKRYFSLATLKSISSQILSGIYHIHEHNFFHRDLKPENILVSFANKYYSREYLDSPDGFKDNYVIKIADYGLSREVTNINVQAKFTAYVSTRWYRSPEILLRNKYYSKPVDIWAFGCVIVELCTFKPLFPGNDELDQIYRILQMLGTPFLSIENQYHNYFPHGGVWEHSIVLLKNLGLDFPFIQGFDIELKISNPNLRKFCDVIKKCLIWNPLQRITVEEICELPYFHNTIPYFNHLQKNKINNSRLCIPQRQHHFSDVGMNFNNMESLNQVTGDTKRKDSFLLQSSLFNGLQTNAIPIKKRNDYSEFHESLHQGRTNIANATNIDNNNNIIINDHNADSVLDGFVDLYNNHTVMINMQEHFANNFEYFQERQIEAEHHNHHQQQFVDESPIKNSHGSNSSIINLNPIDGGNKIMTNNHNSNYTLSHPLSCNNAVTNNAHGSKDFTLMENSVPKLETPIPINMSRNVGSQYHSLNTIHDLNIDIPFPLDPSN